MTVYKIRFEGPATLATGVATALADAEGVELTASKRPSMLDTNNVELNVTVEGDHSAVAAAVAGVSHGLPKGASIEIVDD